MKKIILILCLLLLVGCATSDNSTDRIDSQTNETPVFNLNKEKYKIIGENYLDVIEKFEKEGYRVIDGLSNEASMIDKTVSERRTDWFENIIKYNINIPNDISIYAVFYEEGCNDSFSWVLLFVENDEVVAYHVLLNETLGYPLYEYMEDSNFFEIKNISSSPQMLELIGRNLKGHYWEDSFNGRLTFEEKDYSVQFHVMKYDFKENIETSDITKMNTIEFYVEAAEKNNIEENIICDISVNESVFFGKYEQDNQSYTNNEQIEWIVLDIKNGKALLLSKYILDAKRFNENSDYNTWEYSSLRTWLNNDFYNKAFNNYEKEAIVRTDNMTFENKTWETKGGNQTQDNVFLLSLYEADKYFPNYRENTVAVTTATAYAYSNGCPISNKEMTFYHGGEMDYPGMDNTYAEWWLRSTGECGEHMYGQTFNNIVTVNGGEYPIGVRGEEQDFLHGVRPAIWIDLSKISNEDLERKQMTEDEIEDIKQNNDENVSNIIKNIKNGSGYSEYEKLYDLCASAYSSDSSPMLQKWYREDGSSIFFESHTKEECIVYLDCRNGIYQGTLYERAKYLNDNAIILAVQASDGIAYILFVYEEEIINVYTLVGFTNGIEISGKYISEKDYWNNY